MIGTMSSIISRRFNSITVSDEGIKRLSPKSLESDLGISIPEDYKGDVLPLWRFVLQPNHQIDADNNN
jgi:hypothetical protein